MPYSRCHSNTKTWMIGSWWIDWLRFGGLHMYESFFKHFKYTQLSTLNNSPPPHPPIFTLSQIALGPIMNIYRIDLMFVFFARWASFDSSFSPSLHIFLEGDFAVHRVKEEDMHIHNRKNSAFRTVLLTNAPLIVAPPIVIRYAMVKTVLWYAHISRIHANRNAMA